MADMLVKLYELPSGQEAERGCREQGIEIRRAMAPDKFRIVEWVKVHSNPRAAGECDVCFSKTPISCFIATKGKQMVGYACYHATAPDFFGPTRVLEECQGRGVGKALLIRCLEAMQADGYAYGIIGGVGPVRFYEKCVGATLINESTPGIYKDFLGAEES